MLPFPPGMLNWLKWSNLISIYSILYDRIFFCSSVTRPFRLSSMETYLERTVNPLLEEMVAFLLKRRPDDPVPLLIDFLKAKEESKASASISQIITAIKRSSPILSEDEDEALASPSSTALFSPSHSPSNIAKYYERGARISVSATPTDDILRKYANSETHESKSDSELAHIVNLLSQSTLACGRTEDELKSIAQEFQKIVFDTKGSSVDFHGSIILVESGEIEKICKSDNCAPTIVGKGQVIGAVLAMLPCECEITKLTTISPMTICWKLNAEFFDYIVRTSAINKREKHMHFLASVPILSSMDSDELLKICDALKQETFTSGQFIVHQSEPGNKFYIVESGLCKATKSYVPGQVPTEVMKYGPGDYFGELSLLHDEPRDANVVALVDTSVISLDRKSFKRLLGPIENILRRNTSIYDDPASLL